jgi:hypothetical protein
MQNKPNFKIGNLRQPRPAHSPAESFIPALPTRAHFYIYVPIRHQFKPNLTNQLRALRVLRGENRKMKNKPNVKIGKIA